jgi:tetratricopeptide (TPR) repeat protein
MSSFEFWDELNKIFNAVVAYQEKSIEFNKRFITPWVRLGNVFDKQDRTREAIESYRKALEIDPADAQCWCDLGNSYFKIGDYDEAALAFQRAIELDPTMGWAYSNLALANVVRGNFENAVMLYQKSIELLQDNKDKAVSWNRLGNLYRKMNEYELALSAFQRADELDRENNGSIDILDQSAQEASAAESQPVEPIPSPISLLVGEETETEEAVENAAKHAEAEAEQTEVSASITEDTGEQSILIHETAVESAGAAESVEETVQDEVAAEAEIELPLSAEFILISDQPAVQEEAPAESSHVADSVVEPNQETAEAEAGVLALNTSEPEVPATDESPVMAASSEATTDNSPAMTLVETVTDFMVVSGTETETSDIGMTVQAPALETQEAEKEPAAAKAAEVPTDPNEEANLAPLDADAGNTEAGIEIHHEVPEWLNESAESEADIQKFAAYEEFLRDDGISAVMDENAEGIHQAEHSVSETMDPLPVTKIDETGNVQMEIDINNAKVWNELGNVYYNNGAIDDAVIAYSKAIELDRNFAWPYSNLALTYTQKNRLAEAVLLYQRSIELFDNEKDKAIVWNRLGNLYRRMYDYASAIASYQRADELDPENTSFSIQSRHSLLGSLSASRAVVQEQG